MFSTFLELAIFFEGKIKSTHPGRRSKLKRMTRLKSKGLNRWFPWFPWRVFFGWGGKDALGCHSQAGNKNKEKSKG